MSADGNFKLDAVHPPLNLLDPNKRIQPRERLCGFCGLSLRGRAPVLLKSGQSVHLDCYLHLRKHPRRVPQTGTGSTEARRHS